MRAKSRSISCSPSRFPSSLFSFPFFSMAKKPRASSDGCSRDAGGGNCLRPPSPPPFSILSPPVSAEWRRQDWSERSRFELLSPPSFFFNWKDTCLSCCRERKEFEAATRSSFSFFLFPPFFPFFFSGEARIQCDDAAGWDSCCMRTGPRRSNYLLQQLLSPPLFLPFLFFPFLKKEEL